MFETDLRKSENGNQEAAGTGNLVSVEEEGEVGAEGYPIRR
jgi:hypothetical protein